MAPIRMTIGMGRPAKLPHLRRYSQRRDESRMQVIIDPERSLSEVTDSIRVALEAIKDQHGWSYTAQALETSILKLAVAEWVDKAPGSFGRLKRIGRALKE